MESDGGAHEIVSTADDERAFRIETDNPTRSSLMPVDALHRKEAAARSIAIRREDVPDVQLSVYRA